MLAAEDGIFPAHERLDERVADTRADRSPTLALDQLGDSSRADEVVDDGRAGVFAQHALGHNRGHHVAADKLATIVDQKHAIRVSIERDAHIEAVRDDGGAQIAGILRLDRVGLMIREGAVQLEEERGELAGQVFENERQHLAGHAIAGVDGNPHRPDGGDIDHRQCVRDKRRGNVTLIQVAMATGIAKLAGQDEVANLANALIHRERARFLAAELESVVFGGVMGCSNHHAGREAVLADGEIEAIGRDETDVRHIGALVADAVDQRRGKHRAGDAHVAPDTDMVHTEVGHERAADPVGDLRRQLRWHNPTNIVGLEQV